MIGRAMAMFGAWRVMKTQPLHIGMLAAYGGALDGAGALFSVLLSAGVGTAGPRRLLEGLGFSSGFFFVIVSHAILFTEANVVMPVALLHCSFATLIHKQSASGSLAGSVTLSAPWRLATL